MQNSSEKNSNFPRLIAPLKMIMEPKGLTLSWNGKSSVHHPPPCKYSWDQKILNEMFQTSDHDIKPPTPWKINMEPTNHPFRKENDLPNLHDYCMFHVNLQGCKLRPPHSNHSANAVGSDAPPHPKYSMQRLRSTSAPWRLWTQRRLVPGEEVYIYKCKNINICISINIDSL